VVDGPVHRRCHPRIVRGLQCVTALATVVGRRGRRLGATEYDNARRRHRGHPRGTTAANPVAAEGSPSAAPSVYTWLAAPRVAATCSPTRRGAFDGSMKTLSVFSLDVGQTVDVHTAPAFTSCREQLPTWEVPAWRSTSSVALSFSVASYRARLTEARTAVLATSAGPSGVSRVHAVVSPTLRSGVVLRSDRVAETSTPPTYGTVTYGTVGYGTVGYGRAASCPRRRD
jgi:hypothetical protein